ncbi:MAG: non-ribosomal peptide synthetase [Nocardioides sp.]
MSSAFARVLDHSADRPVIIEDDRTTSFAELDRRAAALAAVVRPGAADSSAPVALLVRDPVTMLAAQLGVLRAGRFFCAVNPNQPRQRIHALLAMLAPGLVISDGPEAAAVSASRPEMLVVDANSPDPDGDAPDRWPGVAPDAPASVLVTSGSTGRPKLVLHNRVDMWDNVRRHDPLGVVPGDRWTLLTADGFVQAISNVYVPLLRGAGMVPHAFRVHGPESLLRRLADHGVTGVYGFPSFLRPVAATGHGSVDQVRTVYLGGEAVHLADLVSARAMFPMAELASGLNSTETGLACLWQLPASAPLPEVVPVGTPARGIQIDLTDELGRPVAVGETGRVVIRAESVRPKEWTPRGPIDLTSPVTGEFPTGDLARQLPNGTFVHAGRSDTVVKVRGYRVSPTETEAALASHPRVAECAVVASGSRDPVELVAHVVATGRVPAESELRRFLLSRLPEAFVPAEFRVVPMLPRTANGKVDRQALSALSNGAHDADDVGTASVAATCRRTDPVIDQVLDPPGDPLAAQITRIWCEILCIDQVSPDEDFFAAGGTSISAVRVVSRVRAELEVPLALLTFFEHPTIAGLTAAVVQLREDPR